MAYIEDTNLIEEIKSLKISVGGKDVFPDEAKESVLRVIGEQPAADVVEVKHSDWYTGEFNKIRLTVVVECSECNCVLELPMSTYGLSYNYCPNCGAKMDGKEIKERFYQGKEQNNV